MRSTSKRRLAAIVLAGMTSAIGLPTLLAQVPAARTVRLTGGFGGAGEEARSEGPAPTVHVRTPLTTASVRTWLRLQKPVPMPFKNETPLEDVLKHVKESLREGGDSGVPIYVDPVGLQEAEKTMTSPVQIELDAVPLATSLRLALKQLGLAYSVQEDGLLVITAESAEGSPVEPTSKMLEDLSELRQEVYALRRELSAGRNRGGVAPGRPDPAAGTPAKKAALRRVSQANTSTEPNAGVQSVSTVHLATHLTPQAAETWLRLQKVLPFPFKAETPLEDVLHYVKSEGRAKNEKPLTFYVDPIGLQEAEKTMTSPVLLELEGMPIARSLSLVLKQLGLRFEVMDDGIIKITSEGNDESPADPEARILDEISAIRMEVLIIQRWTREVGFSRRASSSAPASTVAP